MDTESQLERLLQDNGVKFHRRYPIHALCGDWQVDFYIDSKNPIVIEVKGATASSKNPNSVIPILAKEAFTMFYDLINNSRLPKQTKFMLVHGELALRTPKMDFHKLIEKLGITIIPIADKDRIISAITQ